MKKYSKILFPLLNFLLGLVVYAIISWPIASSDMKMISQSFFYSCAIPAFIIGGIGVVFLEQSVIKSALWTLSGYFMAHLIRVISDLMKDSTDHNLLGIEFFILAFYCFPPSLIGAWISSLISKLSYFRK